MFIVSYQGRGRRGVNDKTGVVSELGSLMAVGLQVSISGQVDQQVSQCYARINTCAEVQGIAGALQRDFREARKQLGERKRRGRGRGKGEREGERERGERERRERMGGKRGGRRE